MVDFCFNCGNVLVEKPLFRFTYMSCPKCDSATPEEPIVKDCDYCNGSNPHCIGCGYYE